MKHVLFAFLISATVGGCKSKEAAAPQAAAVPVVPAAAPGTTPATAVAPAAAAVVVDPAKLIVPLPTQDTALAALAADMASICRVAELSGANNAPPGERGVHTAVWLGSNIHSEEGRQFLGALAKLAGPAKADALDNMSIAVGLADCPLSEEWRN